MHQGIQDSVRQRDKRESYTVVIVRGVTETIYVNVVDPPVQEGDPFDCSFFPLRAPCNGFRVPHQFDPRTLDPLASSVSAPVSLPLRMRRSAQPSSHCYYHPRRPLFSLAFFRN